MNAHLAQDWDNEAATIEAAVSEETGPDFDYCDATLLRYCREQYREATKAGCLAAAERIRAAIDREWPLFSTGDM